MKYIFLGLAVLFGWTGVNSRAYAMNCVQYVKYATGLNLMGNAYQWWYSASNVFDRGYVPAAGSIMVFDRTSRMHVGHVAVVSEVRGSREILIDQANWHHGRVDHGVSVIDTSPANDWSSVQVEWAPKVYGGPFPIMGFIYANGKPGHENLQSRDAHVVEASANTDGFLDSLRDGPGLTRGQPSSHYGDHVRIYSGTGSSHSGNGRLIMASATRERRPIFTLASGSATHLKNTSDHHSRIVDAVLTKSPTVKASVVTVDCHKPFPRPAAISHKIQKAKLSTAKRGG